MSPQKTALQKQRKWSQSSSTASSPRWVSLKYLRKEIQYMSFTSHLWFENAESWFVTHTLIMIPCLHSEFNIWKISWAHIGAHLDLISETYLGPRNGAHQDIQCLKQYLSCLGPMLELTKIFKVWKDTSPWPILELSIIFNIWNKVWAQNVKRLIIFFKGAKLLNGCATKILKLDSAFICSLIFYQSPFALF